MQREGWIAKAHPGKLSYGHSGTGSIQHLTGELFKSLAGTPDILHVPYRGTGPVSGDLVGGQVPMGVPGVTRVSALSCLPSARESLTTSHRSRFAGHLNG
jgi:tripartite-type tricarboxylate transporter receptor subunit TctC